MDLNELLVFTKVVENRSFTGAARVLGLPKSTVSRKVSQLEERLGVRLLQRTTRKLSLTEVGTAYYERCARIVSEVEEAERAVTEMQAAPRGKLRVTAPAEFGMRFGGTLIARFLTQYPELQVELFLSDRIVDLVAEGYDAAIRAGNLSDSSLIARKLGDAPVLTCASPSYLEARGSPSTPKELENHDCITLSPRSATWELRRSNRTERVTVKERLSANNMSVIRDAVLAGLGIGQLPAFLCADDFDDGTLVPVLDNWSSPFGAIHAVYPSTRHLSAKVRAFLDFVADELSPPPWTRPRS